MVQVGSIIINLILRLGPPNVGLIGYIGCPRNGQDNSLNSFEIFICPFSIDITGQWPSTAPEGEPRSSNTKDAEDHRVEIVKRSTTSEPDKTMNKIPQVTSNIQADINEESFPVPTPSPNPEYIQCISGGGKGEHPLQGCSACCINSEQEMNCPYDTVISENTPSNDVHSGEYQIETENEHLPRRPSRKNSPGVGDKNESSFVPLRQSRGGQEISHHHDGRAEERTGLPEKSSEEPTQEDAHNPAYMAWISMSKSEQNVKKNSLQQENGIGRNRSADGSAVLKKYKKYGTSFF